MGTDYFIGRNIWSKTIICLLCLLLLSPGAGWLGSEVEKSYASGAANVIINGSFEQLDGSNKPLNWNVYTFKGKYQGIDYGVPEYQVVDDEYVEGQHSYRISANTFSRGVINTEIALTSEQTDKNYIVQQWVKTEDILDIASARAYVRIQLLDNTGKSIRHVTTSELRGTNDWTLIEQEIFIPAGTSKMIWEGFLENTTGSVWYDDVRMYESQASKEILVNGSFETVNNNEAAQWTKYTFNGSPQYSVDTATARTGNNSYKIAAQVNSRGLIAQTVILGNDQKGKRYRMQQWAKTENFTGQAYTRIQVFNANNDRILMLNTNGVTEASDWTLVEMLIDLPQDAHRLIWESFYDNGKGTVWFDDVSMEEWIAIDSITIAEKQLDMQLGQSETVAMQLLPVDATAQDVAWSSNNSTVATVENGVITALAEGYAIISVMSDGFNRGKGDAVLVRVGDHLPTLTIDDVQATVEQGGAVSGLFEAQSPSSAAITYQLLIEPAYGQAYITADGKWNYYPDSSYAGNDAFYVSSVDEYGTMTIIKGEMIVTAIHQSPQLEIGIFPNRKNAVISGDVTVLSNHAESLEYAVIDDAVHGQLVLDQNSGAWTYTPHADYVGNDTFYVRVTSPLGGSAETSIHVYTAPTGEELIAGLKANNPNNQHPRIMATADDFARIRTELEQENPLVTEWFSYVKENADSILTAAPKPYAKPDGQRLDTTSATRIATLAFTYQITGESKYANRAWEEMNFVAGAAYPDWSPGHFLDTAGMMHGMALGYDWLYDVLTVEQREIAREAIIAKGLQPAIPMYLDKTQWWVYNRDNWNLVTNAGMTFGALAIADEEEEIAALILHEAFKSIQYGLPQYAPDGSAKEGPSYWEYGASHLVYFLDGLDTVFGHDFSFGLREGIAETGFYPTYVTGPKGSFNYFDNGESVIPGRLSLWYAKRYDDPSYTWHHQVAVEKGVKPGLYDLLWYRSDNYGAAAPELLDRLMEIPQAVTMRSDWNNPNALFVGFKGGENGAPHGDLDTGSFVFDANGVRWAQDLGLENYNLPGYWQMEENGLRWTYYRKRAESHNTLVIQPSSGPDQSVDALSKIVKTSLHSAEGAFAIADMTPAYKESALSVKRGTALIDQRREFMVQDEVRLKVPSEMYWFMHTRASIELNESGNVAVLSKDGEQLAVEILSPANASFSIMAAEPLPTSPNPDGQARNTLFSKLAIHLEDVMETTISVRMRPITDGNLAQLPARPVISLDDWLIEEGEITALDGLTVDGQALEQFIPNQYYYTVELASNQHTVPVVAGTSSLYTVKVQQASELSGTATIEVTDPTNSKKTAVYYVRFKQELNNEPPSEDRKITPISVIASADDGNVPENTLDGSFATRWSAMGEEWIQYDLGKSQHVAALAIAWYQGDFRASFFRILLSDDETNWTTVFDDASSGESSEFEYYFFTPKKARYVRIEGLGNSANSWNSIAETIIYGPKAEEESPGTGTPGDGGGSGSGSGNGSDNDDSSNSDPDQDDSTNEAGDSDSNGENSSDIIKFIDIEKHWAESAIKQAVALKIANGYPDGTFKPDNIINREQFTVMLINALNPDVTALDHHFTDKAEISSWAKPAIALATRTGIIKGYTDGSFRPKAEITRAQLAVMLVRALDLPTESDAAPGFADDHDIPAWAQKEVAAVRQAGIMEGRGGNRFMPNGQATRAEAIVVLLRLINFSNSK